MSRAVSWLSFGSGLLLAGCAAAPTRELLAQELQSAWSNAPSDAGTVIDAETAAWWRLFRDPALDLLIARAEARNLDLRSAEAGVREARALRAGAGAAMLPQIDATADFSRGRSLQAGGLRESASLSGEASWELDLFGRLRSERRASIAELEASEADRDAVRLTLLAEVTRSYLEYRLYRVQHDLAVRTAEAQASTLRITEARFRQGMGSRLDVERAQALLATTRATVPQAEEQAASAFHRLVLLTAGTPEVLAAQLPPQATVAALPAGDARAVLLTPTQVLAQRPDVRAAERRLVSANATLAATQALRYPQLNLTALLGVESEDAAEVLDGSRTWSVGAGLLAPLFDFGRIRAAIDVADAREEQAFIGYERTVRTALQEAQTALVLYTQGQLREQELARAAGASRRAAQLARRQYEQGALSLFEVLDAERSLYAAERDWSSALAEVSLRLVGLYQTMGVVPPRASG